MNCVILLAGLALAQLPPVQVVNLAGDVILGSIESLSSKSVAIKSDEKSVAIPVAEILLIRSAQSQPAASSENLIEIRLVDSTRLFVKSLTTTDAKPASAKTKVLTAMHPRLGELTIPTTSVFSVRFAASDPKIDGEWVQLLDRAMKKDVIAVRKGDLLDHLDGVIGSLNEATLQFQMDGDEIAVKREKVFGLIYSKRESLFKKSIAQLELICGDKLSLKQIEWDGVKWKARLVAGIDIDFTPDLFQTLDYSLGKVIYLSDMEPRQYVLKEWSASFSNFKVFEYRRDKDFEGKPISLGGKSYPKGLAIHSQTQLKYRFGGEFRRFQAVMGIGDEVPLGDVDVTLKGDNRVLFKGAVKASEVDDRGTLRRAIPQTLDIDVTGVIEFEIFVDYGSDQRDIGDRLYLANARAVK